MALVFARLEIQIEGPHGWAANLPTWRIDNRWTRIFYGSRPLTGYHLWMLIFVFSMIHAPIALQTSLWSWGLELRIISFYILFFLAEDFLWFVMNPAFGIRRFRREHIWWHAPSWWWVMPRDYWVYGLIGVGAYAISWHVG
jgi:hypothetical protein